MTTTLNSPIFTPISKWLLEDYLCPKLQDMMVKSFAQLWLSTTFRQKMCLMCKRSVSINVFKNPITCQYYRVFEKRSFNNCIYMINCEVMRMKLDICRQEIREKFLDHSGQFEKCVPYTCCFLNLHRIRFVRCLSSLCLV